MLPYSSGHQIEPQQRQVRQVVACQFFAAQVSMHTTQAAKPIARDAHPLKVGQFDPPRIADDHKFNVALAVDKDAQLPPRFV